MKNITTAWDEKELAKITAYAKRRGMSVRQFIKLAVHLQKRRRRFRHYRACRSRAHMDWPI